MKRALLSCIGVLILGSACSGTGSSTAPTTPTASSVPTGLALQSFSLPQRELSYVWNAVPGASAYVLEVGRASGRSDVASIQTSTTRQVLPNLPLGILFVQVSAKTQQTVSQPSTPQEIFLLDFRNIVEALFFGTGPNAPPGLETPVMLAWPRGSVIKAHLGALTPGQLSTAQRTLDEVSELTSGAVRVQVVEVAASVEAPFAPPEGELRILATNDLAGHGCLALGCGGPNERQGVIVSARVVFSPAAPLDTVAHEIGHATLGLQHLRWATNESSGLQTPPINVVSREHSGFPLMWTSSQNTDGSLTQTEREAIRAVYAAGLSGGATRADFLSRGLIANP